MTAIFKKHGISFQYPENWELTEESDGGLSDQVSIETPSGGLWMLQVFPVDADAEQLLSTSMSALKQQYEDIEFSVPEPSRFDDPTESSGIDSMSDSRGQRGFEEAMAGIGQTEHTGHRAGNGHSPAADFAIRQVDAFFYCFDFLVTARIQVIKTGEHTMAILYQAESRDFAATEPVFRAITTSLIQGQ